MSSPATPGISTRPTQYYERALGLWRQGGDASGIARAAHNLAQARHALGESELAAELLLESLAACRTIGDHHLRAVALAAAVAVGATQTPNEAVAALHGAARSALDTMGIALESLDDRPLREAERTLRAALGDQRFAAADARGRALGEQDTVAPRRGHP